MPQTHASFLCARACTKIWDSLFPVLPGSDEWAGQLDDMADSAGWPCAGMLGSQDPAWGTQEMDSLEGGLVK